MFQYKRPSRFYLFVLVFCLYADLIASQPGSSGTQASTSITGAYTRRENLYCLSFTGSNCTSCYTSSNYYFYGNVCTKFQGRTSDYYSSSSYSLFRVCDAQCDSQSCVTSSTTTQSSGPSGGQSGPGGQSGGSQTQTQSTDTGLCTGCKYSSQSFAFYAYYVPTGATNTSEYDRCVTDCDHFGGYYNSLTSSKGICGSCSTGCEICASSSLCIECSYAFRRYTDSSSSTFSDEVLTGNSTPASCSSRSARKDKSVLVAEGTLSRDYYVSAEIKSTLCTNSTCAGTMSDPFDDINLVFVHLLDQFLLGQKQEAVINIYLMKTQASGTTLEHFWRDQDLAPHYTRVFERTAADVTIQPLVCDGSSVTTGCFTTAEKANVVLKSNKLFFFVTKTFTFKNIIVDAAELIPDSTCYSENKNTVKRCCLNNAGTYPVQSDILLSDGSQSDAQCEPPTYTLSDSTFLSVPWETNSDSIWKKGPYAIFVMNFLRDYPKYIPTLVIEGCVFRNFWYHRRAYSFIYIDQRGGSLTITDSTFENFYFPMGLVTNMQQLTQRNSFFTTNLISTKLNNCTTYNSSLSNCQSITIQNSIFQDSFFGNYTFTATDPDYYNNEGIVLSLHEFRGPILIQGNTFQRLASIKYSLVTSAGVTQDISSLCSTPRSGFDDSYRLSLDRHMQVVIGHESWSKTPRSSSVLSLRNVTARVTIYNNTFTNNAAETGTGLFIHNFENTESTPIIVEENTFTGNFATEFGTAIAILKYQRDYVTLECKGLYLASNTFKNNLGCPYVKGTVIVSCMPEKPAVSVMSTFYSEPQSENIQAYMLSYFVSANDVNSFKSTSDGAGGGAGGATQSQSRFTDLQADEIDDLTEEIFTKFIADITLHKDTVNSTIHPIDGSVVDTNRITAIENTFESNYAYHSHLFVQGAYNTLIQENTFEDNSIPVLQLIPTTLTTSITLYKKALGSASYWKSIQTSPLIVRMSNFIDIKDSNFINNTQLLIDSSSLAFGAAITIDKHLGMTDVSISNTTFSSNQGWTTSGLYDLVKANIADQMLASKIEPAFDAGVQGAMITYNYWEYMYGIKVYTDTASIPMGTSGYYTMKSATPEILIDSCTFENNAFNISSTSQVVTSTSWIQDDRTAFVYRYSTQDVPASSTVINSYGSFVIYVNLTYDGCNFTLNTINDQRTFINPYGFNSLTLTDSEFSYNTIVDEVNGYYSLRAYIYNYYTQSSLSELTVDTVTFKNNIGKLLYLEDEQSLNQTTSATIYLATLSNIAIQDHISSPDFLIHISKKQYTTLATITATNVSTSYGFLYLNTPKSYLEFSSITINQVNSSQVGCLYMEAPATIPDFPDFICENAYVKEVNRTTTNITANSVYENRDLLITLSDIPISACFSFFSTSTLTLDGLNCTSPFLKGLSSSSDTTSTTSSDDAAISALCLNTKSVTNSKLTNLLCTGGNMSNILYTSEKGCLVYFTTPTSMTFTSVTFTNNVADNMVVFSEGTVTVTDSVFANNTAKNSGSVFVGESNVILQITNTEFTNNTCQSCEGAIYFETGEIKIIDSNFTNNIAELGGAISAGLTTISLDSTLFYQNSANSQASIISAELCDLTVTNCTFQENAVTAGEAGIYVYEGTISIANSTFINNTATKNSRNVQVFDAEDFQMNNCSFTDSGTSLQLVKGGFVYVRNTPGTITGCTFLNSRGGNGGAVYFDLASISFNLLNSNFTECTATTQGEALYVKGSGSSVLDVQGTFFSCGTPYSSSINSKDMYAVYCTGITCKFTDVIFNPMYADSDTGNQLYLYKGTGHELTRVEFTADCETLGNCHRSGSSALRVDQVKILTVTDSSFTGWGDRIVEDVVDEISSQGGAVRLEFASSKLANTADTGGAYTFTNCMWSGNKAIYGGAIFASGVMTVTVDGAEFDGNYATKFGGAIVWNSTSTVSNFYVKSTVSFSNNNADVYGGAYAFVARKINLDSSSPTYMNNTAIYGNNWAAYSVYIQLVDDPDSSIYSDYVSAVKEKLNIARRLEYSSTEENSDRMLSSTLTSGDYIEPPLVLKLYDEFGQHVATDNSSVVKVTANSSSTGSSLKVDESSFTATNGYLILYPMAVYAVPGTSAILKFNLTTFNQTKLGRSSDDFSSLYTASTPTLSFRSCVVGERLADDNTCYACTSGTYILSAQSSSECSTCPTGGVCEGYDQFGPDVGYFKLSYSTTTVVECSNDEACLGASIDSDTISSSYCTDVSSSSSTFCYTGWCAEGYKGNLCGECRDGYGYSSTDSRTCVKCSNNTSFYVISILLAIAGVIYVVIMIRSALKEDVGEEKEEKDEEQSHKKSEEAEEVEEGEPVKGENDKDEPEVVEEKKPYLQSINKEKGMQGLMLGLFQAKARPEVLEKAATKDLEEISLTSIYLKILTDYIQLVSILGSFSFEWPDELTNMFSSEEKISKSSSEVFSMDCLLRQHVFTEAGLSSFFAKLLIMSFSPIGFGIVIILVWVVIYAIKYRCDLRPHKVRLSTNIVTSMVVTLFILHPTIVELATESFKCTQLGDSSSDIYLEGNLEVKCWEATHLKWAFMIGLPSLIIWGFGIPLGALYVLYYYRKELHTEGMKAKFGFLYEGYFPRAFYWEFVVFYRKMALIIISVFMSDYSTNIQGAIVIGISCANFIFQDRVRPYLTPSLNEMDKRSLIASGVTIYAGLFYLTNDLGSGVKIFFFVVIILANVYFFAYFCYEFLKAKAEELKKIKLVNKLFGRCLDMVVNIGTKSAPTRKVSPMPIRVNSDEIEKATPFDTKSLILPDSPLLKLAVASPNSSISPLKYRSSEIFLRPEPENKDTDSYNPFSGSRAIVSPMNQSYEINFASGDETPLEQHDLLKKKEKSKKLEEVPNVVIHPMKIQISKPSTPSPLERLTKSVREEEEKIDLSSMDVSEVEREKGLLSPVGHQLDEELIIKPTISIETQPFDKSTGSSERKVLQRKSVQQRKSLFGKHFKDETEELELDVSVISKDEKEEAYGQKEVTPAFKNLEKVNQNPIEQKEEESSPTYLQVPQGLKGAAPSRRQRLSRLSKEKPQVEELVFELSEGDQDKKAEKTRLHNKK